MANLIKGLSESASTVQEEGKKRFGSAFGNFSLAEYWDDLDSIGVDPMKAIEQHVQTSVFSNPGTPFGRCNDPFVQSLTPKVSPGEMASKIINAVTQDVSRFAGEYFGQQVGDLLSPVGVGEAIGQAGAFMIDYLLTTDDIKNMVLGNGVEDQATQLMNKAMITATEELNGMLTKNIGKLQDEISKLQEKLGTDISKINDVITAGPKYVCNTADQIDARAKKQIGELIDGVFNTLKDHKKKMIEGLSRQKAAELAEKINSQIKDTTRQGYTKILEAKGKAENMATAAIKKALLNFFAIMGL